VRTGRFTLIESAVGIALSLMLSQHSTATETYEQPSGPPVSAIWQAHDVHFEYSSTTTHYSCHELGHRVAAILRALGARDGMTVQAQCSAGLSRYGKLDVKVAMPVEATPANLERAATFDAKEQLAARVRKQTLPMAADVERFPASRQQVALTKDRSLDIQYTDCDLLQGMRRQVFPQLDIRVVARSFRCDPEPSHIRPKIILEALLPISGVG
jgi:hypothetical protein